MINGGVIQVGETDVRLYEAKAILQGKPDDEDVSARFGARKGTVTAGQLRNISENGACQVVEHGQFCRRKFSQICVSTYISESPDSCCDVDEFLRDFTFLRKVLEAFIKGASDCVSIFAY
jgi:hypothetical protein